MAEARSLFSIQSSPGISAETIFEHMTDMVFVMSANSPTELRYVMINPPAMKASGLNEYAYGATFQDVIEPAEAEFLYSRYLKAVTIKKPVSFVMNHEGQIGESLITPILDSNGKCTHMIGVVRDITDRFNREKNLEHLAFRDQLTGLFNRHALLARLKDAIRKAEQSSCFLCILLLDCDNLKMVNDTFGHAIGDLMLQEVARRVEVSAPEAHTVARTGGDEFLTAVQVTNELEVFGVTDRILNALRKPWNGAGIKLALSASIGVATFPIDSMDIQEVIRIADKGLYTAKEMGGNQYFLVRMH